MQKASYEQCTSHTDTIISQRISQCRQPPRLGPGEYPGSCSPKGASFLRLILGLLLALGLAGLPKVLWAQRLSLLALQPQSFRLLLFCCFLILQLQDCCVFEADSLQRQIVENQILHLWGSSWGSS